MESDNAAVVVVVAVAAAEEEGVDHGRNEPVAAAVACAWPSSVEAVAAEPCVHDGRDSLRLVDRKD